MSDTRNQLIQAFKDGVIKGNFDSMTIEDLTDQVGVGRSTFYHHFQDKYAIFEAIFHDDVIEVIAPLFKSGMFDESVRFLLKYIEENKDFYQQAFKIEGQNSFEDLLTQNVYRIIEGLFRKGKIKWKKPLGANSEKYLFNYYALGLVYILKTWLTSDDLKNHSAEDIYNGYKYMTSHSIQDIIDRS